MDTIPAHLLLILGIIVVCATGDGIFSTITVCDVTNTTANASNAVVVVLVSGTTYLSLECNVAIVFTAGLGTGGELHDVAIVASGGSALPTVLVSATTFRNLTVDISDVHSASTRPNTQIVFLNSVPSAANITVTLARVHVVDAVAMNFLTITAESLVHGLTVALVDCTLRNVSTSGLVVVSGSDATTIASAINVTVSSGQYSLTFLPQGFSQAVVVQIHSLISLSDVTVAARDGVAVDVVKSERSVDDVFAAILVHLTRIHAITNFHVSIEDATASGVVDDSSIGTALSLVRLQNVFSSTTVSSFRVVRSRIFVQAGAPSCVNLQSIPNVETIFVEVKASWLTLVTRGRVLTTSGIANGVAATVIAMANVDYLNQCNATVADSTITASATNSSVLQDYSSVAVSAVMWSRVSNTSASHIAVKRVSMNVTCREVSIGWALNQFVPALATLMFVGAGFSAWMGSFENTAVIVEDVSLLGNVILIPPLLPPLSTSALRAADVTIALVMSTSNWTKASISVYRCHIVVQQMRFLVAPGDVVGIDSLSNCNAIYLTNTTAMISFRGEVQFFDACLSPVLKKLFTTSPMYTLAFTSLSTQDGDVVVGGTLPLFVTAVFFPSFAMSTSVNASNISCHGALCTGSTVALSGSSITALDLVVQDIAGFPLGIVFSTAEASSIFRFSHVTATSVTTGGGILDGNISAAVELTVKVIRCTFNSGGVVKMRDGNLFGGRSTRWTLDAGSPSSSTVVPTTTLPPSIIELQGCNTWGSRPLTLWLARKLLRDAPGVAPGATTVYAEGVGDGCMLTATVEVVVSHPVPRVAATTAAVVVSSMTLVAVSAPSTSTVASMVRLQAAFVGLRVGRNCYRSNSQGGDSSNSIGSATMENPLQLSLPAASDWGLEYAAGCVVGNTILITVAMVLLNLPRAVVQSATCNDEGASIFVLVRSVLRLILKAAPGNAIAVMILLLTPTVTSSVALVTATPSSVSILVGGSICVLLYGCVPIVSVGIMLWRFPMRAVVYVETRTNFTSTILQRLSTLATWMFTETCRWVSNKQLKSPLMNVARRFSGLFVGYRSGRHWYAIVDIAVPVLTGVLGGVPADSTGSSASCSLVMNVLLTISVVAFVGSVALTPCMRRWDNVWAIVNNGLSLTVFALVIADNTDAANTTATAMAWICFVPAVASFVQLLISWIKRLSGSGEEERVIDNDLCGATVSRRNEIDHPAAMMKHHSLHSRSRNMLKERLLLLTLNANKPPTANQSTEETLVTLIQFICSTRINRGGDGCCKK